MFLFVLAVLSADPVVPTVRIEQSTLLKAPVVRVTKGKLEKVCAAGPHALLYAIALKACRPDGARFSVVELKPDDLVVRAVIETVRGPGLEVKDLGVVTCAVRPPALPLRNEAEACLAGEL